MLEKYNIKAFTFGDRFETIHLLEAICNEHNFWIVESFQFSNTSINIHIEGKKEMMGDFLQAIQSSEINLYEDYMQKYKLQAPHTLEKGTSDCLLLVHLEFIHNQPWLKREIPAIPG